MNIQELLTKWKFHVDDKPLEKLEHRIEQIKSRLEFLAAAEIMKGIWELTERFSGFAEGLGTAAVSAGVTVEELQRLQFAASQAGVGAEEVSSSMARLTRMLYEARNGSAEAKKAFASAGITEQQIAGFHTGSDALAALADNMAGMEDPIQKQALSMQLLGRGSFKMVEFLSGGSKAMKELGDKADRVGAVLGGKDVEALREVEDTMSALGATIRTLSAHIAAEFAPSIKAAVEEFQKFYAANKGLILINIHAWARQASWALGYVAGVVTSVGKIFFRFAEDHQTLFKNLGIGVLSTSAISSFLDGIKPLRGPLELVGKLFSMLGGGAEKFIEALKWLSFNVAALVETTFPMLQKGLLSFSLFLEANPVVLTISAIAAAIAALVLGLELAHTMLFKGGDFKDTWIGQLWKKTKGIGMWMAKMLGVDVIDPGDFDVTKEAMGPYSDENASAGSWGKDAKGNQVWNKAAYPDFEKRAAAIRAEHQAYQDKISNAAIAAAQPPSMGIQLGELSMGDPSGRRMDAPVTINQVNNNVVNQNIGKVASPEEVARAMPEIFERLNSKQRIELMKAYNEAQSKEAGK